MDAVEREAGGDAPDVLDGPADHFSLCLSVRGGLFGGGAVTVLAACRTVATLAKASMTK